MTMLTDKRVELLVKMLETDGVGPLDWMTDDLVCCLKELLIGRERFRKWEEARGKARNDFQTLHQKVADLEARLEVLRAENQRLKDGQLTLIG
jgi:hypothetical protein